MGYKMKGFSGYGNSPAKKDKKKKDGPMQGPIPKENIDLLPGEMEDTYVYKGKDIRERIIDLEDRAEFAMQDAENAEGEKKKQHLANAKKLKREAQIMRDRKE